jgi:hypothetical protein
MYTRDQLAEPYDFGYSDPATVNRSVSTTVFVPALEAGDLLAMSEVAHVVENLAEPKSSVRQTNVYRQGR